METMSRPLIALIVLLLSACSGANDGEDAAPTPVARVTLADATRGAIEQRVTLYGTVQQDGDSRYALSAPVEARVETIVRGIGSVVRKGDVVARLQPSPASRAAMSKADSDLRAAEDAYARAVRLRGDGLASDADVESARSAAAAARAEQTAMASSRRQLTLRAADAGITETLNARPGDLVAPGTAIATVSRTLSRRARLGADPEVARRLQPGTKVTIEPGDGAATFEAPITSIDRSVDPQTRLASLFAEMPGGVSLAPGQPLKAHVPVATRSDAVTVPYDAILDDGGQPYVFVVVDGVAHRHDVVTGPADAARIVIEKGVAAGDQVVTGGGTGVEDGMRVRTQ